MSIGQLLFNARAICHLTSSTHNVVVEPLGANFQISEHTTRICARTLYSALTITRRPRSFPDTDDVVLYVAFDEPFYEPRADWTYPKNRSVVLFLGIAPYTCFLYSH
jgi:hypothetical protein